VLMEKSSSLSMMRCCRVVMAHVQCKRQLL
jgi:hypothetical protein